MRLIDLAATISVGVPRVVIDSVMLVAIVSGIFWAGRTEDQMENLTRAHMTHEQLASDLAVVTARQGIVLNELADIKARLGECERKEK